MLYIYGLIAIVAICLAYPSNVVYVVVENEEDDAN